MGEMRAGNIGTKGLKERKKIRKKSLPNLTWMMGYAKILWFI
jgi:hypothetical protein